MDDRSLALLSARATPERVFRLLRVVSVIGVAVSETLFLEFRSVPTGILALACLYSVFAPWLGRRLAVYRALRAVSRLPVARQ